MSVEFQDLHIRSFARIAGIFSRNLLIPVQYMSYFELVPYVNYIISIIRVNFRVLEIFIPSLNGVSAAMTPNRTPKQYPDTT